MKEKQSNIKGNGALDICLMKSPNGMWDNHFDRYIGLQIDSDEWIELFYVVLEVPKQEQYLEGEPFHQFDARQDAVFRSYLVKRGFPLLARITDIYKDSFFRRDEIDDFRQECLTVRERSKSQLANNALEKLIQACDLACEHNSGLTLIGD